ncbi:MAG: DUF5946 family protein [Pseudomonadota bacterium]
MAATTAEQEAYDALSAENWSRQDPAFIQQLVADTYRAQHADAGTKPIGLTFALVGLYLATECGFTGREVQLAHMKLAERRQSWPAFELPADRGGVTVLDVVAEPAGDARDTAIRAWCASVWSSYAGQRETVDALLRSRGIL